MRATYRRELQKGRKAIAAKAYGDAIAALDLALGAKPNDPRALSERGYARLMEGKDLDGASKDFDIAAGGTKDTKLLSMIWFNRGLVDEKRGRDDNARAAFALANALRPTKAAQDKLAGKPACTAIVERGGGDKTLAAKDWLALAKALPHEDEAATAEALAKELTDDGKEPALPAIVIARDFGEKTAFAVWRSKDGGLAALPLATAMLGRCPGTVELAVAATVGGRLHVHGSVEDEGGYTFMCEGKGDELIECEGKDDEVSAGTACLGGSPATVDVVIDTATGARLLEVTQPDDGKPAATAKLVEGGVQLAGRSCDRLEKL